MSTGCNWIDITYLEVRGGGVCVQPLWLSKYQRSDTHTNWVQNTECPSGKICQKCAPLFSYLNYILLDAFEVSHLDHIHFWFTMCHILRTTSDQIYDNSYGSWPQNQEVLKLCSPTSIKSKVGNLHMLSINKPNRSWSYCYENWVTSAFSMQNPLIIISPCFSNRCRWLFSHKLMHPIRLIFVFTLLGNSPYKPLWPTTNCCLCKIGPLTETTMTPSHLRTNMDLQIDQMSVHWEFTDSCIWYV